MVEPGAFKRSAAAGHQAAASDYLFEPMEKLMRIKIRSKAVQHSFSKVSHSQRLQQSYEHSLPIHSMA